MTTWAMAGGFTDTQLQDLAGKGVRTVLAEAQWALAEPTEGRFDYTYLDGFNAWIGKARSYGHQVMLNFGLHHAPAWLLAKPNAKFVAPDGIVDSAGAANLVGHSAYRMYGERYTSLVFSLLGFDFPVVRLGGGHWGELTYPRERDSGGKWRYWGWGSLDGNPVKGWRPGQPSLNGEAGKYLSWYLNSLSDYQMWQFNTLRRAGYKGTAAMLYPSWGMRTGDYDKAVADNCNGMSSAEVNGEVQGGYDHPRHISKIAAGSNVAVWGTWAERVGTLSWLGSLATARQLKLMGENAGGNTTGQMQDAVTEIKNNGGSLLMWVRASEAYSGQYATVADYLRLTA